MNIKDFEAATKGQYKTEEEKRITALEAENARLTERCAGLEQERDVLQAKLAAAVEALRKSCEAIEAWEKYGLESWVMAELQGAGKSSRAILAGHVPATPMLDHKRVWVGPGHLESTGYIDPPATKGEGDE